MWFATDAGVSRFNGYEFENFDASDGLTDNTVFLITEDSKGRIWFGTFNCQLSYFENDSIYPYKHNNEIKKRIKRKRDVKSFYIDTNDNIWMGFYSEGIYKCEPNGEVSQIIQSPEGIDEVIESLQVDSVVIFGSMFTSFFNEKMKDNKGNKYRDKKFVRFKCNEKEVGFGFDNSDVGMSWYSTINPQYTNAGILLSTYLGMVLLNEKKEAVKIKETITSNNRLLNVCIEKDFLWLCIENEGVYRGVIKNDSLIILNRFLENKTVARIYKDNEDGFWFLTLKEGIYYLPTKEIRCIVNKNDHITAIEIDSLTGVLYTTNERGSVIKYLKENLNSKKVYQSSSKGETIKFNYQDSSLLLGFAGGRGQKVDEIIFLKNGIVHKIKDITVPYINSFLIDRETIYGVNKYGLSIIKDYKEIYNSFKEGESRIWCTSLIKNGNKLWIGTNDGIRVFQDKKITAPYTANRYLSSPTTCIERLNEDIFLIGTKSYGVLVIKNDNIIDIIDVAKGLVGNLIRTIHVDNQKVVWVGTNKGLTRINYQNANVYQIYNLTKSHGLISPEIIDISSYKNTIYAATTKGLIEFDKTKVKANTTLPPVYIKSFSINEKERYIGKNDQLNYKENNIKIDYVALNYRSVGERVYQYRILVIDTNWLTTMTRNSRYPALQSGDYTFEVKAKNEDGYWSEPTNISFTINPPFWLTWWFIAAEILVGLTVIFIVFKYRVKQLNDKNKAAQQITEAEKRMVELELKALRSQMNPHFIFNTLNSIQHYIAENDFKSTNKYITQFAKLIRTVLNLSEKKYCTIQEELEMLTLYMDLEKMRFENEFDYQINVSKEIDQDYDEIPSMLIQPYVENAIWHGLMNKKNKGAIKIGISLEENYLRCSIEDNGIGRAAAAEVKAKRKLKRKSVGMSITKERLDIINEDGINIKIVDLKDNVGNALGTKVTIKISYSR
jgi:ligand-binding sensor domain-containing protein